MTMKKITFNISFVVADTGPSDYIVYDDATEIGRSRSMIGISRVAGHYVQSVMDDILFPAKPVDEANGLVSQTKPTTTSPTVTIKEEKP